MAIDKDERIVSKAACFYSPTLQYLNHAPSKRKYLKITKSKEKLTPKDPAIRAKTPVKKRSPNSIPKHHVSKSLASALKIDNRKIRKKHSSMQIETEFTPPPRYPGFPE